MPSPQKIHQFIQAISGSQPPGMFNPWSERPGVDLSTGGYIARRKRLAQHLDCPDPRFLLIGEAAGYQGCRFSGIPFTSERLLLEGKIPRVPKLTERITTRTRPWSEPSATIVWGILHELELAEYVVLFNAVPWHPEGKKGPLSNRTPTLPEKVQGQAYLKLFIALFPDTPVAALGTTACAALDILGVAHKRLRHPAYGGATKFRDGLRILMKGP